MSAEQVEVVKRLFAAAARGDTDGINDCLHRQFTIDQAHGTPYAGTYRGLDGFLKMFGILTSHFDIKSRDQVFHDTGNAEIGVIVTFDVEFTSRKTGQRAICGNVELYRFADGRIRHIDVFYKNAQAVAELASPSGSRAAAGTS
ncbi:nuclear transport factor 2 family protein [Streptomyces caniscabiei]|uniref:nuclear transport factor 2 family protein n=1 Tax=Streptomyces caniscabiei TaxID=2746961 RepID=UPI000765F3CB|nr:nuclear transport factor 2 family protein [Streptomyces caniscabiei]